MARDGRSTGKLFLMVYVKAFQQTHTNLAHKVSSSCPLTQTSLYEGVCNLSCGTAEGEESASFSGRFAPRQLTS